MKNILIALLAALIATSCASTKATADPTKPHVELNTTEGLIVLELYPEKAPKTVENFLQYVKDGYYNGTIFHRVIDNFMVQGGGYDRQFHLRETRPPIENESNNGLKNDAATVAMARTSDPNSASSQFFINLIDNDPLNYPSADGSGYAVFGRVVEGFDVVQKIGKMQTGPRLGGFGNVPTKTVEIVWAILRPAGK